MGLANGARGRNNKCVQNFTEICWKVIDLKQWEHIGVSY
jgi:hypothetical protein